MLARAGRAVERGALTKSAWPTFPEAEPTVLPCTAGNTRMDPQGQRFHGAFSSASQEKSQVLVSLRLLYLSPWARPHLACLLLHLLVQVTVCLPQLKSEPPESPGVCALRALPGSRTEPGT